MKSAEETMGWAGFGGWGWMEDPWLVDKSQQLGMENPACVSRATLKSRTSGRRIIQVEGLPPNLPHIRARL